LNQIPQLLQHNILRFDLTLLWA